MNAFGDDYVSFVPMHLSFSPDGRFILISTGKSCHTCIFFWNSDTPFLLHFTRPRQTCNVLVGKWEAGMCMTGHYSSSSELPSFVHRLQISMVLAMMSTVNQDTAGTALANIYMGYLVYCASSCIPIGSYYYHIIVGLISTVC